MFSRLKARVRGWFDSATTRMGNEVIMYSRRACCLCDEAEQILRDHGLTPRVIDIDGDPGLCDQFTHCVPVVVIDGKERFRGRVNPALLRRLLR